MKTKVYALFLTFKGKDKSDEYIQKLLVLYEQLRSIMCRKRFEKNNQMLIIFILRIIIQ
jgi:hypothetical protein